MPPYIPPNDLQYTTLQRLKRDGLVESDVTGADGRQNGFQITTDGEEELVAWLRTPLDMTSPLRDELVIRVLVALRVPGIDVGDLIQVHRRHLVELMQQWTRLKEDAPQVSVKLARYRIARDGCLDGI